MMVRDDGSIEQTRPSLAHPDHQVMKVPFDSGRLTSQRSPGAAPSGLELESWWGRLLFGRRPARTLIRILVLGIVCVVLFKFVLIPVRIVGHSMEPTYRNGRIAFINRLAYRRSQPRRGDVVGIQIAGPHVLLFKRVVGLPNERVAVVQGVVYLNGQPLEEPYVKFPAEPTSAAWQKREIPLSEGEYWVMGDNRKVTDFGGIETRKIVGKALF
jgi:signal peptidase I